MYTSQPVFEIPKKPINPNWRITPVSYSRWDGKEIYYRGMAVSILQPAKYGFTPPKGKGAYYEVQLQVCNSGRTISRDNFFDNPDTETLETWACSLVDEYLSGTLQDEVYMNNENCKFVGPDEENPYLILAEKKRLMTTTLNHDTRVKDLVNLYNPEWMLTDTPTLETLRTLYLDLFKTIDFDCLTEEDPEKFLTLIQISLLVSKIQAQEERFSNSGRGLVCNAYFMDYSDRLRKSGCPMNATFQRQVIEYLVDKPVSNIQINASLNLFILNGLTWRTLQRITTEDFVTPMLYPNFQEGNNQAVA